jgi:hypothetical protein
VKLLKTENYDEWKKWNDQRNAKKQSASLSMSFKETFDSQRNIDEITKLLSQMGKSFEEFKAAICDETYKEQVELSYWADEHCVISNCVNNDFDKDFRSFERLLKTMIFQSREVVMRFITYFIHEFYVFSSANSNRLNIYWTKLNLTKLNYIERERN